MLELKIFSDLALIHCFHSYFVCPHFEWMQSTGNLSGIPGFQSHNTLGCYFLMVQDLIALSTTINTTHPAFTDFQATLTVCPPELCCHQESKASKFVSLALEAINKHFVCWCNALLLPAALLLESPLAKVIAQVVLKRDYVLADTEFKSKVHERDFDIPKFNDFLRSKVTNDGRFYPPLVKQATEMLLDSHKLRDMNNENDTIIKNYLYAKYLPLPHSVHRSRRQRSEEHFTNGSIRAPSKCLRYCLLW
jgi:hypothetical protein